MRKKKQTKVDHCAVDPAFDGMIWNCIGTADSAASVGELVLWRRVILQALFDFLSVQTSPSAIYNRNAAERWFLYSTAHFSRVCALADVDGEKLRRIVRAAHDSPDGFLLELRGRIRWP